MHTINKERFEETTTIQNELSIIERNINVLNYSAFFNSSEGAYYNLTLKLDNNNLYCNIDANNLYLNDGGKLKHYESLRDQLQFFYMLFGNMSPHFAEYYHRFDPSRIPVNTFNLYRFTKKDDKYYLQREFIDNNINIINIIKSNKLDISNNIKNIYDLITPRYTTFFNNFNNNNTRFKLDILIPTYYIVYNITDTLLDFNYIYDFLNRINLQINDINNVNNLFLNTDKHINYKNGLISIVDFDFKITYISEKSISYVLYFEKPVKNTAYGKLFNVDINPEFVASDNFHNTLETNLSMKLTENVTWETETELYLNAKYNILLEDDKYFFIRKIDGDEYNNRKSDITILINEYINILNNITAVEDSTTKLEILEDKIVYIITKN
jgi:hypothetical protein